jgi:hypothetical protein
MVIAYAMNRMSPELLGDTRGIGIITAAYVAALTAATV